MQITRKIGPRPKRVGLQFMRTVLIDNQECRCRCQICPSLNDHNFYHPHINVVTFVPSKHSKSHNFFPQKQFFVEKVFNMYLLLDLSSLFSQNSRAFNEKIVP